MLSDFPAGILEERQHRPWPVPRGPWIMTQSWHDLLFAHWPVDAGRVRALVPRPLPLDCFDGCAWVGIVPFRMTNVAPRGVPPVPGVSAFPELNVRTYVTVNGRPGIYFFSLDAASRIAVAAARLLFGLPYYRASMAVRHEGGRVRYRSVRLAGARAELRVSYWPAAPPRTAAPRSLEHFLTERYCLYTVDRASRVRRLEIHHPPWRLQAADAHVETNTMIAAAGLTLPAAPPLLHFAARQDMVAWPLVAAGR